MLTAVSFRSTKGLSKDDRGDLVHFHEYIKCRFTHLAQLLRTDGMYSSFAFLGHHCTNDNLIGESNLVILDVDDTTISIHDRSAELSAEGISHIIGTTSDPTNLFKYRILLLLDSAVDPPSYRLLVRGIQQNGLVADVDISASVRPSGKFFSYAGSTVVSDFTQSPLCVADYILEPEQVEYCTADPTELLDNFDANFRRFADATPGNRTRRLFAAAFTLRDAGCTYEQIVSGVLQVNSMFLVPKLTSEVHRRVLTKFTPKGNK